MTCSAALPLESIVQCLARARLAQAMDAAQLALDLKEWLNARGQGGSGCRRRVTGVGIGDFQATLALYCNVFRQLDNALKYDGVWRTRKSSCNPS